MSNNTRHQIIHQYLQTQAPILFLVFNRAGKILEANEYAAKLVGWDIRAKTIQDIFVDFAMSIDLAELAADPEQVHLLNVNTFTGLPQTFYFNFFDQNDQILALGCLNLIEIETLRKQLVTVNNELHNLNRELQKKNAELGRLNQLKNQFLGMATHDLRRPLSLILMYSEFLLDETKATLSPEHHDFLTTIYESSEFMRHLIDDFLDIAVIESGQFELDLQPTDLLALIKHNLTLNDIQARKKEVRLHLDQPETMLPLMLDGPKIEQVLTNLISNAIDYSDPGATVNVSVSLSHELVLISVQDTGPGISQAEIEQMFQPFNKTRTKKKVGEKSIGLGLVIAHQIVKAHQGAIGVESEVGQGASFYFSLPIKYY